jgi:hypothetical protein
MGLLQHPAPAAPNLAIGGLPAVDGFSAGDGSAWGSLAAMSHQAMPRGA